MSKIVNRFQTVCYWHRFEQRKDYSFPLDTALSLLDRVHREAWYWLNEKHRFDKTEPSIVRLDQDLREDPAVLMAGQWVAEKMGLDVVPDALLMDSWFQQSKDRRWEPLVFPNQPPSEQLLELHSLDKQELGEMVYPGIPFDTALPQFMVDEAFQKGVDLRPGFVFGYPAGSVMGQLMPLTAEAAKSCPASLIGPPIVLEKI